MKRPVKNGVFGPGIRLSGESEGFTMRRHTAKIRATDSSDKPPNTYTDTMTSLIDKAKPRGTNYVVDFARSGV